MNLLSVLVTKFYASFVSIYPFVGVIYSIISREEHSCVSEKEDLNIKLASLINKVVIDRRIVRYYTYSFVIDGRMIFGISWDCD